MEISIQRLSKEQLALLPSDDDVAFYEEHGWYVSKKVIADEIIDQAILGSERFYRGERDTPLSITSGYSNWKPEDGNTMRNNEFVSLQNKEFRQLAFQPIIGAIAARLAKTKQVRLFEDQILYKPPMPEKGTIGWHTDRAYCSNCTSDRLLAAWIPFHDCDESIGPLVVLDGSHKWSGTQDLRFFNHQNLEDIEQKFRQEGRQIVEVSMTLKKGQISFHHCGAIHGSHPNRSKSTRLAMAVHLQDDANRYQPFWNQKGEQIHHALDHICRELPNGNPDYSDPAVFPVIWSEEDN